MNISPGLIEVRKHILEGLIFGGHFVLVSEYQDFKIHCIYPYYRQKGVSLGQNHLYIALKPI